ncbi:armadillo repeat-containing protein 4 armc4 [Anaeramoeba flamelloides]|uniref:Armadillo repeat-containing protein 4 armc4 n=1 Tax=Anaeramoeba flamelloides TaxID=1746091 RepID=A0ABQ8YRN8_9EUKA|nr:armadillo repeat-containing protein 4 armc4 [Anaeramoeba flamelloides]
MTNLGILVLELKEKIREPEKLLKRLGELNKLIQKSNSTILIKSGALDFLVKIVLTHENETRLIQKVLGILNNCSLNTKNCKYLGKKTKIIPFEIKLMKKYSQRLHTRILSRLLGLLWNLSNEDQNIHIFHKYGGYVVLLEIMRKSKFIVEIQLRALGALNTLATSDFLSPILVREGALRITVETLKNYQHEHQLILRAVTALFNFAANNVNSLIIGKTIAPKLIAKILFSLTGTKKEEKEKEKTEQQDTKAKETDQKKQKLPEKTNKEKQKQKEQLINRCLAFFSNLAVVPENISLIASLGLIPKLTKLCIKYKNHKNIPRSSLNTLHHLLQKKRKLKQNFSKNKGVHCLIHLMTQTNQQLPIIKKCSSIILALSVEDSLQEFFIQTNTITSILNLLKNGKYDPAIMSNFIITLSNFFYFEKMRKILFVKKGIEVMTKLIKKNWKNEKIAERASLFFLNISSEKDARRIMEKEKWLEFSEKLLDRYYEHPCLIKRIKDTRLNMKNENEHENENETNLQD